MHAGKIFMFSSIYLHNEITWKYVLISFHFHNFNSWENNYTYISSIKEQLSRHKD
jgi:hypothetical protein